MKRYNDGINYIKFFGEKDTSFPYLLAVLCGESVNDLTIDKLSELGMLGIAQLSNEELLAYEGMNEEILYRLKAMLGIINQVPQFDWRKEYIIQTKYDVLEYMEDIRYKEEKQMDVLFLNDHNIVIGRQNLVKGTNTLNQEIVKFTFRQAIKRNASKLVVCSNDPCGYAALKSSDFELFGYFLTLSTVMNVEVIDHIILGRKLSVSVREKIEEKRGESA